jgi:hypothetical protein
MARMQAEMRNCFATPVVIATLPDAAQLNRELREIIPERARGVADAPSLGGEFELQDPRGVAPAMDAPLLGFGMPGGQAAGAGDLIRPKSGQLMLFPSWLLHAGRRYRGERERISVAFNLGL